MSDPLDRLDSFDPGVPVSAMTAADVRRKGERRRRRTTRLVASGAALAVIAVATPLALLTTSGSDPVDPSGPAGRPLASDVDLLDADEVFPRDGLEPWVEVGVEDVTLTCQSDSLDTLGAGAVVRRQLEADTVPLPGTTTDPGAADVSAGRVREAVLQFDEESRARQAYKVVSRWIAECDDSTGTSTDQPDDVRTVPVEDGQAEWQPRTFPAGAEVCGDSDCDAVRFDQMGVARIDDRLVVLSLAEIGGSLEPVGLDQSMDALLGAAVEKARPDVDALPAPTAPPGPDTDIPTGFPIDQGLVAMTKDGGEKTGPAPDATGVTLLTAWCGSRFWPAEATQDRLATSVSGPEYFQSRELVTFATAAEAEAVIRALSNAVVECPLQERDVPDGDPGSALRFTLLPDDTGADDSTTFSAIYASGLTGNSIYQFTRIGNAVLASLDSAEISAESAPEAAMALSRMNAPLVEEMCAFTGAC